MAWLKLLNCGIEYNIISITPNSTLTRSGITTSQIDRVNDLLTIIIISYLKAYNHVKIIWNKEEYLIFYNRVKNILRNNCTKNVHIHRQWMRFINV